MMGAATLSEVGLPRSVVAVSQVPLAISGLQCWLKADAGLWQGFAVGIPAAQDGDPVGLWQDQSGNGNALAQQRQLLTKRPALRLAVQNNLPVVQFDGVNDVLSANFTLSQPSHVFAVVRQRTWVSTRTLFDGGTSQNMRCYQFTASPGLALFANGASQGPAFNGLAVGAFGLLECLFNGNAGTTILVNAGTATTETAPGTAAGSGLSLGGSGVDGAGPSAVDFGEVLVYSGALTGTDLTNLRNYLKTRWGTP